MAKFSNGECSVARGEGYEGVACVRSKADKKSIVDEWRKEKGKYSRATGCSGCHLLYAYDPDEGYEHWLETRYADEFLMEEQFEHRF